LPYREVPFFFSGVGDFEYCDEGDESEGEVDGVVGEDEGEGGDVVAFWPLVALALVALIGLALVGLALVDLALVALSLAPRRAISSLQLK
jgi:hypothetical protein